MIYPYKGNYQYNILSVMVIASSEMGVYYCWNMNSLFKLIALYVGRAKGDGVSIRNRLLDHLQNDRWSAVTHFGYRICTTKKEAEDLEVEEIQRLKPDYNELGKGF